VDLDTLRNSLAAGNVTWRGHAVRRLIERGYLREGILAALAGGNIVESYPDDTPYPSALILGFVVGLPVHVVAALDDAEPRAYLVTVYRPSTEHFEGDWLTRKR
jgi:hypothetical protein